MKNQMKWTCLGVACLGLLVWTGISEAASDSQGAQAAVQATIQAAASAEAPAELKEPVLPPDLFGKGRTSRDMMRLWLIPQVEKAEQQWKATYEKLKTPEQIAEYQQRLRAAFLNAIGGLPERTPLEARTTGTLTLEGMTIEKVLFQSQPGQWVSGLLYLPDETKYPKPWDGVLIVCGHSNNGKGYVNYQRVAALHAYNGMATLIIDPIDQGERPQLINREEKKARARSVHAHNLLGVGSILLGWNTARYEIWDMMRALDYLQTRPEINHDRLGVAGLSGGGTQTAYIMALDDRVSVAASCCYLCSLTGLMKMNDPQDAEQNIFGQTKFGMDHADYCIMRAPKPTLLGTATKDFFPVGMAWDSFRSAKRILQRLGYGENMDLAETDNEHGYDKTLREATVRFMLRFLEKRETPVFEPDCKLEFTDEEIQVTPDGLTMLLPGARSTYDLNRDEAKRLAELRKANPLTDETLPKIRELAGIRPLAEIPEAKVVSRSELKQLTPAFLYQQIVFQTEQGIYLPAVLLMKSVTLVMSRTPSTLLYVNSQGKKASWEDLTKSGYDVILAVDLRGWGETQQVGHHYYRNENFGSDGKDFYTAHNLGKTYVGFRTEDILTLGRWLKQEYPNVALMGVKDGCIPVLHAAALEKGMFEQVVLRDCPESWTSVVNNGGFSTMPLTSTVHGALRVYDLPELREFTKAVELEKGARAIEALWPAVKAEEAAKRATGATEATEAVGVVEASGSSEATEAVKVEEAEKTEEK